MHTVDPARVDLAHEFRAHPLGPHSPDLQKLLKLLRWEPIAGRHILVQPRRDGPWFLAETTGAKGCPLKIYEGAPFARLEDAYFEVFRKRWEEHTGGSLDLEGVARPLDGVEPVWRDDASHRPLLGYADEFSVINGGKIGFKITEATGQRYQAQIVRIRSADHANVGLKIEPVETSVTGTYEGRHQPIEAGSYVDFGPVEWARLRRLSAGVAVWPTLPGSGEQALLGNWDDDTRSGFLLYIDEEGAAAVRIGDGSEIQTVSTGRAMHARHWYRIAVSIDPDGDIHIAQAPAMRYARDTSDGSASARARFEAGDGGSFRFAAWSISPWPGRARAPGGGYFNGKLERPWLSDRARDVSQLEGLASEELVEPVEGSVGLWDFSRSISSTRVDDISGFERHGHTVNLPARAVKGIAWDGSEYHWVRRPEHYGAIHFHDDDLYDCEWDTDFEWAVPPEVPSGLYAAHVETADSEDWIPFVVRPPVGQAGRSRLALVLPSASYWAYGNRHSDVEWRERENVRGVFVTVDPSGLFLHEHPEFGVSMYDEHSDGSGVCYASRLRPVLSLRPKETLWQLPADTHIIDWLEEKGIPFDVLTEDDLDAHGDALLAPYLCVMTGTHPEYPSKRVLDAFASFQARGGRFIYLGGNGFYWRVEYHPDLPGVMEMRRSEDGIRSWLAEGGEYYHSFSGELGGMWRRMGRAPQSVAGVGMTAQGFDRSTFYERTEHSFDARAAFIFEGIEAEERIGDFGLIGGGAAGWEVDRADTELGTPPHALVVAAATNFSSAYHWMKEELTHTHSAITGETCPWVRADMVFYETPNGGATFSTGSIAWAGSLSHDGYDNNVSRITENVIRRFMDPEPF